MVERLLEIQYNPDFTNSHGTEKIVQKIGGLKNRGNQTKKVDQLKNTRHTCFTFLSKNVQYTNTIIWA